MRRGKVNLLDKLSVRWAIARERRGSRKLLQTKRMMTLMLGAALSVGGVSEGIGEAHLTVEKDLNRVKVLQRGPNGNRVVVNVGDSFAANSIYKLAALAPDSLVSRRNRLVDDRSWIDSTSSSETGWLARSASEAKKIGDEITLFNDHIREQFFRTELPYGDLIHEKAQKYDVDPALVAAVIETESRFRHDAHSSVGARGLMQLMPRTGRWMGARDLYDPDQNVDAGVKYLKYLQGRFDGNLQKAIAAYNAGEGNVRRYNGVPPYRETRNYVTRVMRNYKKRNDQLKNYSAQQQAEADAAALGR